MIVQKKKYYSEKFLFISFVAPNARLFRMKIIDFYNYYNYMEMKH